jgi:hypothetical protein
VSGTAPQSSAPAIAGAESTVYFKVFGLQRSGTNLARAQLSQNFHVQYLQETESGWKHGPLRLAGGMWKGQPVRFVLCVKNPYAWALSCYHFFRNSVGGDPTMAPQFQRDPSMSFEEFLLTPSYSFETPMHRWNQMNRLWLSTLPADRTLVVRQEDQLIDQQAVLQQIDKKLGLKRRSEALRPIEQRVDVDVKLRGEMNRDYYLDRQYLEAWSPTLLDRINSWIDPALMRQFDYPFERWTIEQRQIGVVKLFVRLCTSDSADAFEAVADPFRWQRIKERGEVVETILDGDAGVGAWAAFAKGLWPAAKVMAFEPSSEKFSLLRTNTRMLPDVTAVHSAGAPPLPRALAELGSVDLLKTGSPGEAEAVIGQLVAGLAIQKVRWLCARLTIQATPALQALSQTHSVETWSTPAGTFLVAHRRS